MMRNFEPLVLKGKAYTSLDAVAIDLMNGVLKMSDIPYKEPAPAKRLKKKPPAVLTPLPPMTEEDRCGRPLFATFSHAGDHIELRLTPKWPFVAVPLGFLNLPEDQQKNLLRHLLNDAKSNRIQFMKERETSFKQYIFQRISLPQKISVASCKEID